MRKLLFNFQRTQLRAYAAAIRYYNNEHQKVFLKLNRFPLSEDGLRLVPGDVRARGFEYSIEVLKDHKVGPAFDRMLKIKKAEYNTPMEVS